MFCDARIPLEWAIYKGWKLFLTVLEISKSWIKVLASGDSLLAAS
jgi:hypothetical protein